MPVNVINSGTPLAPGASQPLWTALCDNSSNLTNTAAPAPLVVPLSGAFGPGTLELPAWVQNLDQIESVVLGGTMKGKRTDTISLSLKHETYGTLPILTNHSLLGNLTNPYPMPGETKTFLFSETVPPGYIFQSFAGPGVLTTVTLPENVNPNLYYYYSAFTAFNVGFTWQPISFTPGAPATTVEAPAHRYPYTPDWNYDNNPGAALVQGSEPVVLIYRGFRYQAAPSAPYEPRVISTRTMVSVAADTGPNPVGSIQGYYPTGVQSFPDFTGSTYGFASPGSQSIPFGENLYSSYGAQDWQVRSINRTVTQYVYQINAEEFGVAVHVLDTYTIDFLVWPDITWSVTPLAQVTWQAIFPPSGIFQFYPPDYADWLALAERSETLNFQSLLWKGNAADGIWTIEYAASSPPPTAVTTGGQYPSAQYSPTVAPAIVRIDNLTLTINFKANEQYQALAVSPTTPVAGVQQAYVQGNLRPNGDDRSLIAVLCGINGSTTMGILCGYSVLRTGRNGEIYSVSYFVATTCNINHVNLTRILKSISYLNQNWGDRPFSTKGDAGEAFVLGPTQYRIYPVRGQIGLQVQVQGNQLLFQMMGQYPQLVFLDPTVALITSFQRISLNA